MRYVLAVLVCATAFGGVPVSPRIESLKQELALGDAGAEHAFWSEVSKGLGTPLIECPRAAAPDCLVTFLWRGDEATRNVVMSGEALPGKPEENLLERLAGTNVWYRTYRFRNDARFAYMLSINDPLTPWEVEGPERKQRYAGLRTDPLNRRNWCYVSLPRAPSEHWVEQRAGVARGEMRRHKLSGGREIEVYTTAGFRPGGGITPVLILFDGEEARDLSKVPTIVDNLFAAGRVPPMVAVMLPQPYERREADLMCSAETNRYVADVVLSWVREHLKIRTAPSKTVAAGASLGGLAAAYLALERPDAIGRVLSQSGSFWWGKSENTHEWLTAEFLAKPRVSAKFYLDVGLMETNGGELAQLPTNRRFRDALRRKGYAVTYREFNGPHGFPCWRANFGDALVKLLSR